MWKTERYQAPVSRVFHGFQGGHYVNTVWIMFLRDVKTLAIFLLILGIIKRYEYRMVPYIVADQPDIPAGEAFAISREMMMGQKLEAWILDISFIGWWLLRLPVGLPEFSGQNLMHMLTRIVCSPSGKLDANVARDHPESYGTQGETL